MRFLMKKTSYQYALVSAGEPRETGTLPVRYELPYPCDPSQLGHQIGVFAVENDGSLGALLSSKKIDQQDHQGFDELEFQPEPGAPFCLVYATGNDFAANAVASFRFTTRPET